LAWRQTPGVMQHCSRFSNFDLQKKYLPLTLVT
jgi:hypothetical protein